MLQQYRYISGRTLMGLSKLDRCQSLSPDTWTPVQDLWSVVFISHRWGSEKDPDPSGSQLATLKRLVQCMVDVTDTILDPRVSYEATCSRLSRIPSLRVQGTLQAAQLVFRTLANGAEYANQSEDVDWVNGDAILDVIGFWYDYSCLPQDPKTPLEQVEFSRALQEIDDMISSPQVSTLILRKAGDAYLSRGWCVVESVIAYSKDGVQKPMVLRTDEWAKPFSVFNSEIDSKLAHWEDKSSYVSAWEALCNAIQSTALPMALGVNLSRSEFSLTLADSLEFGHYLLAAVSAMITVLPDNKLLDLSTHLPTIFKKTEFKDTKLECRYEKDYILVSLLLLKSVTGEDATGDVALWREALRRFTEGLSITLTRRDGKFLWLEENIEGAVK